MSDLGELDDVVREFLVESYENLDQLDRDLVALEKHPDSRETLGSVFRTIHTIKGTCGFLGFGKLERVAHVGESLLAKLRDGELRLDADITTGLLSMVDAIREMLAHIEADRDEGSGEYGVLVEVLQRLQEPRVGTPAPAGAPPAAAESAAAAAIRAAWDEALAAVGAVQAVEAAALGDAPDAAADHGEPYAGAAADDGEPYAGAAADDGAPAAGVAADDGAPAAGVAADDGPPRASAAADVPATAVTTAERPTTAATGDGAHDDGRSGVADSSIRVDVGLLDKLMNLVGELVLARNQVLQYTTRVDDGGFQATSQRLNLITTELQEGVMKTRMQPIGNVFNKLPRLVRDLAVSCGKDVCVEIAGRETELDKTIIEAIKDPLTHVVRNAVDHGIEAPERREQVGKPRQGRLMLRAFHEGGQVNIEIGDDGAGLDLDRVREKAVQRGFCTAEQAARMSDREVTNLIFLPGFSTAAAVTKVSGRGVGMDVVRTNVEKIGGTVEVQTRPGQGTTLRIKIPLTLAIIPALMVVSGGDRYAIPQVNLLELVRLEGVQAEDGIESIHGAPVHRLRGELLPLVYLHRALGVEEEKPPGEEGAVNIVVLRADGREFGLVVEAINDSEEIVVKPLGSQLKGVTAFAGATILGDGKVALILDVVGLAQRAGVVAESHDRSSDEEIREAVRSDERETLLLVGVGARGRLGIPLSLVARLEELDPGTVEQAGGHEAVQYRGGIMRLVRLTDVLGLASHEAPPDALLQVVVYARGGRSLGLVVDSILDIVEEQVTVHPTAESRSLRGSAVVQGRVTDILDLRAVVRDVDATLDADGAAV